jgi:hypothetical protein
MKLKNTETNKIIGKVYKITDKNETECFIGCTSEQYLSNRIGGFKTRYKKYKNGEYRKEKVYELFDKYGPDNCKIILIENFEYTTKDELQARESHFIQTENCINKK